VVDVLDTGTWSPSQALLRAQSDQDEMEHVAIVYVKKDENFPRITCSSIKPVEMNFLGFALQQYSLEHMKE
jgi:hypothetical protein